MQRMVNRLDGLYLNEKFILIDTMKKYQFRKHSAVEFEKIVKEKKDRNKKGQKQKMKVSPSLLKKAVL